MSDIDNSRKIRGEQASKQQRMASNPKTSVWVEASAGTGKTKVLSDRVLRLLLDGVRPEKILCLTYTKAAAVEMSSRIAGRLSRWSILGDNELYTELGKLFGSLPEDVDALMARARKLFAILLDTPGGMKIQTIHSFCQEILKRFPLEAKISPYFEVMDDRTANEALTNIKIGLIKHIESNPDSNVAKALAYLTRNVSEYSFPKIMGSIADNRSKISKLLERMPVEDLILELASRYEFKPDDNIEDLIHEFFNKLDENEIRNIMQAWFNGSESNEKQAIKLASILESEDKDNLYEEYRSLFLTNDGTIKKSCGTKDAVKYYPNLEASFNDEGQRLLSLEDKIKSLNIFESTKAVLLLAEDLIKGYNEYKAKMSKMDYEDLIVITKDLLGNKAVSDWVLFKLDGGIDHILIDEAQDTSPNQWEIIKSITQEFFSGVGSKNINRTVFAVGDRKQSIYSFQGADPREFQNSQKFFANKTQNFQNIRLEVSFRSTSTVLDLVNDVFSDEQAKKGVVLEGEDITHTPFRLGDAGKIELWPILKADNQKDEDVFEHPIKRKIKESASSKLAKQIAQHIKTIVDNREILPSKNRPIQYGDFLILVQRRNSFVEELVRECKNINVSIAGIDKIKLLEQIAIEDLIAIGQFLLLPTDDLTLATILKSPIFSLDDNDLFELCYGRGNQSLWQRLGHSEKYKEQYNQLKELLNKTDFLRPFELYSYILNKFDGRRKFIERMGFEVIDGLEEFMNLTIRFEQEHIPSLQGFIDWIIKDEIEIKREQEQSNIDAVRIMTVHGSKGLQAPIVILPDTVRVVSSKKESGIIWDDLFYYPLSSKHYDSRCLDIKEKEKELSLEEYRRLLYVALTRAEDRLCICGYNNKGEASDDSWYSILGRRFSKIGSIGEDEKITYSSKQERVVDAREVEKQPQLTIPEFDWISSPAKIESPLAKPFAPSKDDEENEIALISPIGENGENRYKRGLIIHKLLQFLPNTNEQNREAIIKEFLEKNAPDIYGKQRIVVEVMKLFEDNRFKILFGENSREEVPIMGEVDGKIISAQIDRLVVLEDKIMIVDFKTNRPAALSISDVPKQYLKQLDMYKKLLSKIYQNRNIETYILWTDIAELMFIG